MSWDPQDGAAAWDVASGRLLVRTEDAPGPGVSAAWSPDETQILTEGGAGPSVREVRQSGLARHSPPRRPPDPPA